MTAECSFIAAAEIDLHSPETAENPLPIYEELRRLAPVVLLPKNNFWIILGFSEANRTMKDAKRFSNKPYEPIDIALLSVDPPRHTIVRQVIARQLSSVVLDRLTIFAENLAGRLLAPAFDVVSAYAQPLSRRVAAQLIGFDEKDTETIIEATTNSYADTVPMISQFSAIDRISHRSRLYRDLVEDASGLLTETEIGSFIRLLWVASTITTERLISNCVLRLLYHNDIRNLLLRDPALLSAFMDEVTRLHPPEPMILRVTTEAVYLGEILIPANANVQICMTAVNRDPLRFEAPAEFRTDRGSGRHLAYGAGPHHCIGVSLARRVLRVAIATLLRDMPSFRADHACGWEGLPPLHALVPPRLVVANG